VRQQLTQRLLTRIDDMSNLAHGFGIIGFCNSVKPAGTLKSEAGGGVRSTLVAITVIG
jgi:hypothetical protein